MALLGHLQLIPHLRDQGSCHLNAINPPQAVRSGNLLVLSICFFPFWVNRPNYPLFFSVAIRFKRTAPRPCFRRNKSEQLSHSPDAPGFGDMATQNSDLAPYLGVIFETACRVGTKE